MIVACCNNNGIGFKNSIPWFIKNDLKYFSKMTKGDGNNAIIMGRKTWDSLPRSPLPNRENVIITRSVDKTIEKIGILDANTNIFISPEVAIDFCRKMKYSEVWIIGGTTIYEYFFNNFKNQINNIYITKVLKDYECDVFFPDVTNDFIVTNTVKKIEKDISFDIDVEVEYQTLERKR